LRIAFAERQVLSVNLNELRQKEVINTRDGRSLGRVVDIEFCVCDGRVTAIVVPGEFCFSAMLRGERTGAAFSLGQQLRVRVANVELARSAVDLELCDPLAIARRERSAKKQERARMRAFHF